MSSEECLKSSQTSKKKQNEIKSALKWIPLKREVGLLDKNTNLLYYKVATRLNYESLNETDCILNQTWNLSNLLHQQDSRNIQSYLRKTRKSRHFWPKIENGTCLFI